MPTSISTRTPGSLNPTRQQLDELDALLKRMLELPVNQLDEGNEAEAEDAADEPPPPPVEQPAATEPATPSVSYMVIETASPRPLPPASGFEPRPSPLAPMKPPVNTTAEQAEPPAAVEPAPTIAIEAPASDKEAWVPLRSTWQPSAQTWQPLAESWRQANGTAATPAAVTGPTPRPQLDPPPLPAPSVSEPVETAAEEQTSQAMTGETLVPPSPPAEPSPAALEPAEPRLRLTAEDAPVVESRLLLPLLWFNQGFDACMAPLGAFGRWLCSPSGRQMLGIAGLACLVAAAAVAVSVGMSWTW
jgi:hypothetical protein